MSLADDGLLDLSFLHISEDHDHDILDEFLDHRVYDLVNNTPVDSSNATSVKPENEFFTPYQESIKNSNSPNEYLFMNPHQNFPMRSPSPHTQDDNPNFDMVRGEFSKLKYGIDLMNPCPETIEVPQSYLDFSPSTMASLPYKLHISNLPTYSRVETQIKINFNLSPPPPQRLLHIPQDLISKYKFCLKNPVDTVSQKLKENMLFLDTYVLTTDLKSCTICSRCIKREQKRASRRKPGIDESKSDYAEPTSAYKGPDPWANDKMNKKAIIFNCKEVVSFPPPTGLDASKTLGLSARIICYCRHHKELTGFKLLFVLKNAMGQVVAKQLSSPIMIMDRKKNATANKEPAPAAEEHPLSPNSIDESSEVTDDVSRKRKKPSFDDSTSNPMYNSVNGFSPTSNSDTNSFSINKPLTQSSVPSLLPLNPQLPSIQRIIPAQGPIRGGIEITLLGFNFRPGLAVKFGASSALATHCWSETTIVTYLPPAAQPGQVLVSFESIETTLGPQSLVFTYTDDTDRQLIELALQIVGLKMNGKLEDAKNIAKRIVGSDSSAASPATEWYDSAHKAVESLTRSDLSTEQILINFLSLVDLPNCPIVIPNWQLSNSEGQSLLHLATLKGYDHLIRFLITHGCKIDLKDNQGLTPLFLASMCGNRDLINIFLDCKSNWNIRLSNDKHLTDYCDMNVLDIFDNLEKQDSDFGEVCNFDKLNKSMSLDSLNSMFTTNYGKHILKMVEEPKNGIVEEVEPELPAETCSDFADSEYDSSDESVRHEEDDYESYEYDSESEVDTQAGPESSSGLWQRVKNVFNAEDGDLPSYDDLFPSSFRPSPRDEFRQKEPKSIEDQDDVASDSSEDMAIYIQSRKPVESDKMLMFFWFPVLITIISLFLYVSIMGYKVESIENFKFFMRNTLGKVMVGGERIRRVFNREIGV